MAIVRRRPRPPSYWAAPHTAMPTRQYPLDLHGTGRMPITSTWPFPGGIFGQPYLPLGRKGIFRVKWALPRSRWIDGGPSDEWRSVRQTRGPVAGLSGFGADPTSPDPTSPEQRHMMSPGAAGALGIGAVLIAGIVSWAIPVGMGFGLGYWYSQSKRKGR